MSAQIRINKDIHKYLSNTKVQSFSVIELRDYLMHVSSNYKNKGTVRLFVSRQLESLVEKQSLTSTGTGRKKMYSKSTHFDQMSFIPVGKRGEVKTKKNHKVHAQTERESPLFEQILEEKTTLEGELSITLAELDEYKSLMSRSNRLKELLTPAYSETKNKAAKLVAKLNVWTKTISLLKSEELAKC